MVVMVLVTVFGYGGGRVGAHHDCSPTRAPDGCDCSKRVFVTRDGTRHDQPPASRVEHRARRSSIGSLC